jgi:hypothetical protein
LKMMVVLWYARQVQDRLKDGKYDGIAEYYRRCKTVYTERQDDSKL